MRLASCWPRRVAGAGSPAGSGSPRARPTTRARWGRRAARRAERDARRRARVGRRAARGLRAGVDWRRGHAGRPFAARFAARLSWRLRWRSMSRRNARSVRPYRQTATAEGPASTMRGLMSVMDRRWRRIGATDWRARGSWDMLSIGSDRLRVGRLLLAGGRPSHVRGWTLGPWLRCVGACGDPVVGTSHEQPNRRTQRETLPSRDDAEHAFLVGCHEDHEPLRAVDSFGSGHWMQRSYAPIATSTSVLRQ